MSKVGQTEWTNTLSAQFEFSHTTRLLHAGRPDEPTGICKGMRTHHQQQIAQAPLIDLAKLVNADENDYVWSTRAEKGKWGR